MASAVVATRSCTSCSRGTCVSAICFGSACPINFSHFGGFCRDRAGRAGSMVYCPLTITSLYISTNEMSDISEPRKRLAITRVSHLRLPDWRAISRETFSKPPGILCGGPSNFRRDLPLCWNATMVWSSCFINSPWRQ